MYFSQLFVIPEKNYLGDYFSKVTKFSFTEFLENMLWSIFLGYSMSYILKSAYVVEP